MRGIQHTGAAVRAKQASIRLFVFDLDNTALGGYTPYHKFPERFVKFINSLRSRGIGWATCTTWGIDLQFSMVQYSGITNPPTFLSGSSGLELSRVRSWKLVPDEEYRRHVAETSARFRKRNWQAVRKTMAELLRRDWLCEFEFNFQNIVSFKARKGRAKAVRMLAKDELPAGQYYEFNPKSEDYIILMPHYMNKGAAVAEMQKRLRICPDETLVAGDGTNDLSMMAKARWAVCPSNAAEEVKQAVISIGGIVGSRKYSDGVIAAAEKLLR